MVLVHNHVSFTHWGLDKKGRRVTDDSFTEMTCSKFVSWVLICNKSSLLVQVMVWCQAITWTNDDAAQWCI